MKIFHAPLLLMFTVLRFAPVRAEPAALGGSDDEPWTTIECPSKCRCVVRFFDQFQANLRTIDCASANLYAFPSDLPSDLQALVLANNHIRQFTVDRPLPELIFLNLAQNFVQSIDESRRELFNLKSLDLSYNRLDKLDEHQFDGLFNLQELNLAENLIFSMDDRALAGLPKLETLHLSGNRLQYVQNRWWSGLKCLYDLHLDRNQFTFLQADVFKGLASLLTLDLSKNKLFRINDQAFQGLQKLELLNLDSNLLVATPRDSFKHLQSIKSMSLSRNALFKIRTDDFAQLPSLRDLSLSHMPRLRLVERGSFKNLPQLLVLHMHDNPYLGYVDRSALVNTPLLSHLHAHNNNLTVLERPTLDSLPALQEVSFYGNPLLCDCNARWLNQFLTEGDGKSATARRQRRPLFSEAERMVCDGPAEHRFKLFTSLSPADMPRECGPRILRMFDSMNVRQLGDDIAYDCRAIGVPKPTIAWVAPNGQAIMAADYHPRRMLLNGETLVIRGVKMDDAGTYGCIAENDAGSTVALTRLNVSAIDVELHVDRVTPTSVTVSWTGADRDGNVFQLQYRLAVPDSAPNEPGRHIQSDDREGSNRHRYAAMVTPVMKSYTLQNLRPGTPYEICLSFEDSHDVMVQIYCTRFTTTSGFFGAHYAAALERTSNVAVGAALAVVACVLIVLGLVALRLKQKMAALAVVRLTAGADDQNVEGRNCASSTREGGSPDTGSLYDFLTDEGFKASGKKTNILYSPLIGSSKLSLNDSMLVYV